MMFGGIVGEDFDSSQRTRGEKLKSATIVRVKTTTLSYELDKIDAPRVINYLSLDVEGAEWVALKNFDYEKYKFKFMTIERPSIDLDLLLHRKGCIQVFHSHCDVIYAHRDFANKINWAPNCEFAFTPVKDW